MFPSSEFINISQVSRKCKIPVNIDRYLMFSVNSGRFYKGFVTVLKHIFYLAIILIVPLTLYILSLETVIPTPSDEYHEGITEEIKCFDCHGDDKEYPRKKEHPPKDQCFKCHKRVED
jgi:hypothetical protein